MNLPLEGGQHAELRDRLTYGQGHAVRVALLAVNANVSATVDLDIALVGAYVAAWNVLDLEGMAVPLDKPELAPDDIIQAIALRCMDLWNGKPDPKGTTGRSATTSPARRSGSRTR